MQPMKKFISGPISATIWLNTGKENKEYKTVSFARNYKDKDGNWKTTNSLRINDLPRASLVLSKAYEYLVTNNSSEQQDSLEENVVY